MFIDVVSDTVCPWCYIGKRRLARALAMRPESNIQVRWRPYRLDPTIPKEGVDRRAYLKAKFGDSPRTQSMGEVIRAEGKRDGIDFAFEKIARSPNTTDSHRLVRWAATADCQDDVVERLFAAYFIDGKDVSDRSVLVAIAEDAGMDAALVADLLEQEADTGLVEREDALAHEMGISGVPTFIFDNKFMLSGAQEPEVLARVIEKAMLQQEVSQGG
jgi:predicted DsbA family dithiol-disulfide isomerase